MKYLNIAKIFRKKKINPVYEIFKFERVLKSQKIEVKNGAQSGISNIFDNEFHLAVNENKITFPVNSNSGEFSTVLFAGFNYTIIRPILKGTNIWRETDELYYNKSLS